MIGHPRNVLRSVGFGAVAFILAAHVGCGSTSNSTGYSGSPGGGGGSAAGAGGGGGGGGAAGGLGGSGGGGGAGGGTANNPDGGGAGGGGTSGQDGGGDDGGNVDAGGPSSGPYPPAGLTIDVAQVVNGGAAVMSAPVIVTVTWSIDPDAATYNAMGDAIGASSYWHAINSEYGVGPATSGTTNHVSITTPPTNNTIADTDVDSLVDTNVGTAWPASTANTMYMIYLPPGVQFTTGGQDACATSGGGQLGGYHTTSQQHNYVYGIALHCSNFQTGDVELSASHEMNEAVTDPLVGGNAWVGFDANHLSFEFFNAFQDELGDACESFIEATDTTDLPPYTVQRQWSNKSAAAGSHWCVPALNEPFYNVTYASGTTLDTITANLSALGNGAGSTTSKGFKVAVGASRTFQIEYFSDVQTQTGFTLDVHGLPSTDGANTPPIATDQSGANINNGDATVTIDNPVGSNGMTANVTITPKSFSSLGLTFFYIRAVLPGAQQHHYLPILISQN